MISVRSEFFTQKGRIPASDEKIKELELIAEATVKLVVKQENAALAGRERSDNAAKLAAEAEAAADAADARRVEAASKRASRVGALSPPRASQVRFSVVPAVAVTDQEWDEVRALEKQIRAEEKAVRLAEKQSAVHNIRHDRQKALHKREEAERARLSLV